MTKVVDVEQRDRLRRYKETALIVTLILLMVAALILAMLALSGARSADRRSLRTEHNLCIQVKGINKRDRDTLRGSPEATAALLRLLGNLFEHPLNDAQIQSFIDAQQPGIEIEVAKRPDLICAQQARPVRPPAVTTGTETK